MKGSDFLASIGNEIASQARDEKVVQGVKDGAAVRWDWMPVTLPGGRGRFMVAADYLSIGIFPDDWVRVPVGGRAAQQIADILGAVLPCPNMVDLIWAAADVKLAPQPYVDLKGMTTTRKFAQHHALIEKQRKGRRGLVAGQKKDVVVSNKLEAKPSATCIYGWTQLNGEPIQSVSTAHNEPWYSDYSHGIRLVHPEMVLDGVTVRVQDVMRDPERAALLTGGVAFEALKRAGDARDAVLRVVRYPVPGAISERVSAQAPQVATTSDAALGERATDWCLAEMARGVGEQPPGSNSGPDIARYLSPARRRGTEAPLGLTKGDWCAAAQSAALAASAKPGEPVPHLYRVAVAELREDAKQCGAWVPIDDVRRGAYAIKRGDLLVFHRGPRTSGLGHVARVDVPPGSDGIAIAIGGNEDNAWKRRERDLAAPELEGVIRYSGFRPVLFLHEPQQSSTALVHQAKPDMHDAWARDVFLRAWDLVFPGQKPTDRERQIIMAIGRYEGKYGRSTKPGWENANNWGGIQCGHEAPCGEQCFPSKDKRRNGEEYDGCFRKYPSPEEGAKHLITLVTLKRPHVWQAIKSGTLLDVATEMGTERVIDGKTYRIYHETNPPDYAGALERHLRELAEALGEPLSVGASVAASKPATKPAPAKPQQAPPQQRPRGLNLFVAQRRPELANVFVGASVVEQRNAPPSDISLLVLRLHDIEAMWKPYARGALGVTVGFSTNLTVLDRANRLNDYINALHAIVEDERKKREQPDGFPWSEWAAYRVSWSECYFEITHGFILWFADTVVSEYDQLARKWSEVINAHYGRTPQGPLVDKPVKSGSAGLWFLGGTTAAVALMLFLRRK